MKKTILELNGKISLFKTLISGLVSSTIEFKVSVLLLAIFISGASACKQDSEPERTASLSEKSSGTSAATTLAQTLPGGKARYTWVNGNFDLNGYTWERIVNLTFTASSGTVGATLWTWRSDVKSDKAIFNSHFCTFDGISKTCEVYTPGGWVYPAGQYVSWSGTYTYNSTTGRLDITWTTGTSATESWQITNPTTSIARAALITSSYTLTHGRGYGSNASWSTYKTIAQMIPFPTFSGTTSRRVFGDYIQGRTPAITVSGWGASSLDLSSFSTPSSPSPANTMHAKLPNVNGCQSGCSTSRTGIVYHLASNNNGRQMAYNNFCACLPKNNDYSVNPPITYPDGTEFPRYPRNLHPLALTQIIDDNNNLVALIGVEAQNPAVYGFPNYQFQLVDFNNIP
ncbi:hypothetical protein [Pedobacter heparinus]|uniref:hypothetical protein n=1 Tax=Pedobacter heparinus TaxID=984 RepID=UPI0029318097|nr:hypothetical protein [Pedobacter heparinus]